MKSKGYLTKVLAPVIAGLLVAGALSCGQTAGAQTVPTIGNVYPSGAVQFQPSATLSFNASSSAGIDPSGISVQLTGTSLPGQTFGATLTATNGLTVTGTSTSRTVSAPFSSNTIYTVVINVTNVNGQSASSTVSFDTINPAYTFEAEDYDYNSGHFIDNPQTNAYAGLNAVDGVDAHNTGGGSASYRPNPSGLATEPNGDKPRLAYSTGKTDYDVGWNSSGGWGNYTRTFPAGTYNIYMRAANPNSFTIDAASMSGAATGTFSVPNTGSWQTYTWIPLLDTNGNLAKFTGGAVKTLRVATDNGSYNANFYLLMPADLSLPVITNIYPDGSSFFQFTNQLSFVASSASGIATSTIVVTLDGVNVSNSLNISGSPASWYVSCPLTVNTNHTAVITVKAYNGQTATATVNFNDFQSTNYQWEAEDYDYNGGQYFDNPQTNAYAGLASIAGVDNQQSDLTANPFLYRPNSPAPSTTVAGDGQRPQFIGKTDYNIGYFGGGSWVNYTRHYPAGTYYVWGRFAEGGSVTEAMLSQLTSGYGTSAQTSNYLGAFYVPNTGGWATWAWAPLNDAGGNPLKLRFDGSQATLQLGGSPVGGQPEVNVNFLMLIPAVPDPFTVLRAVNSGTTNVQITYSKPVEAATATNIANYVFNNGVSMTSASLSADYLTVVLTTTPLVYGTNYTIIINGVRDRMNLPNTIATNTTVTFPALPYTLQDIGNPPVPSVVTVAGNGIKVTAVGSDTGGTNDQGNFSYQLYSGNFDVSIRLASLGLSDIFAKAGLMAREGLTASARFAASLATPAMNGTFFEWRNPAGSVANTAGNFPANYPDTWLRLQRVGNTFTGYAGYDGQTWTQLGSATITMSNQVYLGCSVSSHSTNQVTTAQFRDMANVTNAVIGAQINPHEAIGPSSRKTPIVFSEIMYKPAPRTDGENLEFIELYNSNPWFQDISGYQITCADMNYTFPAGTMIPGGGYLVVAAAAADIESVYGITNVMGPYTGSLKKSETLELLDEEGAVLLTVPYSNVFPWPVATDSTGHSLVLANPTYGEGDPRAWDISDVVGGSPGQMEAFRPSPLRNVVINEFLAHTDPPDYDYIELYNHSTNSVDISGCILTDDPTTNKFVITPGTIIPARGFIFYSETNMNFALDATGESIYFKNADQTRILDAVQFDAQQNGVATGRWPDGANDFYRLSAKTPGGSNAPILLSDIVINELMYDPISGNDDDQYIELYNRSTNTVNMGGWQFTTGVTFTFPNVTLAPNGYLVVARNLINLFAKYPNLNSGNTVGNFSGKLSHNGEYLALTMPAEHKTTDRSGNPVTNIINIVVNDLTYGTGGRWGQWSAGGGSSLELIDPNSNNRLAANWADSDDTAKSAWTNIEFTGVLDNGNNYDGSGILYAQIGILDAGECLVDNVEVDYNGSNYVSNPTFESGATGWSFQGCMARSSLENTGYGASNHSLHIRSSDHIWPGDNSCQVSLNNASLQAGQTATLRFKARWLHGWPEALLRLNGNWLEAAGALPVPSNLGSPGLPNSRYATNAGPAIYNVTHTPTLPAANQSVVVTAKMHDPNGVQSPTLFYRIDPATAYTAVAMKDDGTGGDAVAGDGIFSATIPGQSVNTVGAFYISATDRPGASTRFPALLNDNSPARECVVMFGDGNPGGSFGVYHLWITQTNATRWANLSDLSNEGNDCTFVSGSRVIYNAQGRFAGSAWHQNFNTPYAALCHYKWMFPDDDKLLGTTSFNKLHQPGNYAGDDASLQREQLANTFLRTLGVPWLNRRYVAVYVNGNRRGPLMEDTQCPDSDVVKEHFPDDSDGYLYKLQQWIEFAPFPSGSTIAFNGNVSGSTLMPYTTTGGVKKVARYRYNYLVRRTPDSASDYTNIFSLIDAAGSSGTPNYVANLENMADMENWMRVFAANHAAGNWDCFGGTSGQNLYGYIGSQGTKYSLLMFDFNMVIGNSQAWGPGQNLLVVNSADPNLQAIFNNPAFLRMYWRALQELVNGPLNVANSGPLLDARYNALVANSLSVENPDTNIEPWLSQAQSSIASQLAAVNATSFTVNPTVTVSNNLAYVTGGAPVNVDTIEINGFSYPVAWTTLTNWIVTVPLTNGINNLSIIGVDRNGQPIAGDTNMLSVTYNHTVPSPVGQVVINEIMYNPPVAGAQFVELYNNSTNVAFDLSGWQLQGLSYTSPNGSIIGPTNFLVLAANNAAFAAAYGATIPVFDTFSGTLQPGQILSLVQPGGNGTNNLTVTEVKYDSVPPWPTNANGTGASLQLIDPHQNNWRVGNWSFTPFSATPGSRNSVASSLTSFPSLWINEVQADNLTGITNSAGQHTGWLELYNPSTNVISLNGLYLANNYTNLLQWAFPSNAVINATQFKVIFADGLTNLSTTNELHTGFILPGGTGSLALTRLATNGQQQVLDYVDCENISPNDSYGSLPDGQSFNRQEFFQATPGAPNNGTATPPPSFVDYSVVGSVYTQNFDTLPDPGTTSVNTANTVTINGVTYSLANPYDFAYPVIASGSSGGLGISALAGWYGTSVLLSRFGATDGDQTTGGQISFGLPSSSNRALGLLATSTTGGAAFGVRFINGTTTTLTRMNLQFTGEVWRQSNKPKTLQFYYFIDPTGTNAFPGTATAFLPVLNVNFQTVPADSGGVAVNGTSTLNQTNLSVLDQTITNWPSGAALWLVWQMMDSTGTSQGLGIDNLSFSANVPLPVPVNIQISGTNLFLNWSATAGQSYQLEYNDDLSAPTWTPLGSPVTGTGGTLTITNNFGASPQRFFRLRLVN